MEFLRKIPDEATFPASRYEPRMLCRMESAWIILTRVPGGCTALPRHTHEVDQLYYVLTGRMQVELGHEEFSAGPGSLVFIPAGVPHENRNDGSAAETHLEILAPAPPAFSPAFTFTDSREGGRGSYYVKSAGQESATEDMPGFERAWLADRRAGSASCGAYVATVRPGAGGPGAHIHDFDQMYYVLAGKLEIEVAGQRHTAGPGDLAVLPAGVPHRHWNEGPGAERHLALLLPEPAQGEVDTLVQFSLGEQVRA